METEIKSRKNFVDIGKGVCILLILITHYSWTERERLIYLFPFWINMAVPFFMLFSGYCWGLSYSSNDIHSLSECYIGRYIFNRIKRFVIPYCIYFCFELFTILQFNCISFVNIIKLFLTGGGGPGSYYVPIMVQLVIIYPIIYIIIYRRQKQGVCLCLIANIAYEILHWAYDMNTECYRLLIFRYIAIIAFGCYMALYRVHFRVIIAIIISFIGGVWIYLCCYKGYQPLFFYDWSQTSCIACLFIVPLFYIYVVKAVNIHFMPLELIGRASYNIFLTQMLYYGYYAAYIYAAISDRIVQLIISISICLIIGLFFYYFHNKIGCKFSIFM